MFNNFNVQNQYKKRKKNINTEIFQYKFVVKESKNVSIFIKYGCNIYHDV